MMTTIKVRDGQLVLLFRDGLFQRVLQAGKHRVFGLGQVTLQVVDLQLLPSKAAALELIA